MKRRGIGLVELLIAIPLIGVVSWVLANVFVSSLRELPALHRMTQVHVSLCSFAQRLQRDADSATSVAWAGDANAPASQAGELALVTASGPVVYRISSGRAERWVASAGGPLRVADRWEMPASHIDIEILDGAVSLTTAVEEKRAGPALKHLVLRRLIRPGTLGAKEATK